MYKKMKNFVNKEVKKCKAEYYSHLINKNKGNPNELWKTFNEIMSKKSNSTITSFEADSVLYTETNEIAQALTHFSRIGIKLAAKIKERFFHLPFRDETAIINRFPFVVSQNPLFSSN